MEASLSEVVIFLNLYTVVGTLRVPWLKRQSFGVADGTRSVPATIQTRLRQDSRQSAPRRDAAE